MMHSKATTYVRDRVSSKSTRGFAAFRNEEHVLPLVVHFKRPPGWRATISIHYWDTLTSEITSWPGLAMTAETNDWYTYELATAEAASIVFNDGGSRQTGNLHRDRLGWYYTNNTLVRSESGTAGDPRCSS